jgi:two-component system, cell cycle sensor histidine kinase and response regulator CckA
MIWPKNPSEVLTLDSSTALARSKGILIVDDEYGIRSVLAALLEEEGYRVFQASNGSEASEVWSEHHGAIDLVLCDFSLPDASGDEVVQEIRQERPDLKVIFMSGMVPPSGELFDAGACAFLEKPFDPRSLSVAIRGALQQQPEACGK